MESTKKVGIIAIAIVLAGSLFGVLGKDTIVQNLPGNSGDGVGALTGPDLPYTYFGVGGVRQHKLAGSLTTATTTVCAIQSPVATSTLVHAGIRFDVSSTTASTLTAAKATTPYATTTLLFADHISAGAQASIVATTTTNNYVFGPSEYLVYALSGGAGTFSPTGNCQATFEAL